ncbi:hypothetical protein [Streptomyces caatingaensis]|uniref:hypothetical protein n=1 Tax=Streptomyces caatingaensis TaxID=1678637 RepID=UPI00069DF9A4|nr:hypothetical protein [Streptomyces caatingaensis]
MSPKRAACQLRAHFGEDAEIDKGVRIDLPGFRNGFCPDVAEVAEGAEPDAKDRCAPKTWG